ncbi:MAG TPA: BTAD domain-containing putative transcriptional regulator [Desulfotignum sp.]|nr:BTAD domain-containing putative transcriptional regulator [Desulfotignum sp.]
MVHHCTPPHIPDPVIRKRLFDLLEAHEPVQNILITGQAAQGKTTLAASFLRQVSCPVLWFSLSKTDNTPAKLFDRLFWAMGQWAKETTSESGIAFSSGILGVDKGIARHLDSLSLLIRELPEKVCIVLDDFENLKEDRDGFKLIHGLTLQQFRKLKLFILSRTRPPFDMVRLQMTKNLFTIYNDDLSFTLEETRAFLSTTHSLSADHAQKIQEITGGWPGGVTLAAQSIRQFNDSMKMPALLSANLFTYFSQEIFQALPAFLQGFLLHTSIMDRIDPDVVSRTFADSRLPAPGMDGMLTILCELEKRHLFIQRIDTGSQPPWFTYHQLFKEFLVDQLLKSKGKDHFEQLNKTVGRVFWEKRDPVSAIPCFVRARAFDDIIKIIKTRGTDCIITGRIPALEEWILQLPLDRIEPDPWLLFFSAIVRRIKGGKKNIQRFRAARKMFENTRDTKGMLLTIGYLIEGAVFVREPAAVVLKWIHKGEQLLLSIRATQRYPWARALLLQQIGLGYIAGYANFKKGVSACRNAVLMAQQINDQTIALNALIIMTYAYVQSGDLSLARQTLLRISRMTREGLNPEYRALKRIVDINFALQIREFEEARRLLELSETDIDTFGLIFLYPGFVEVKALYFVYTGQFADARGLADHLNDFAVLEGNDFYTGLSHRINALSFFHEHRYERAKTFIHLALKEFDPQKKGRIQHFLTRHLAGMIHCETNDLDQAETDFLDVLAFFEPTAFDLVYAEACLGLGLTRWRLDQKTGALSMVEKGLEKAMAGRHLFFPTAGPMMIASCLVIHAASGGKISDTAYQRSLLTTYPARIIETAMADLLAGSNAREKAAAMRRLRPVYKAMLPVLRINTLGHFELYLGSDLLDKNRFGGQKPLMLLKSLVLRGLQDIPKEILVNDLWPDAGPKAGEKNFKTNLHRVRKALEPVPHAVFGYAYIFQKAGLVSLDPDLVRLDIDLFTAYAQTASRHEAATDYEQALAYYDRALSVYRGDFFADDLYLEEVEQKRAYFRLKYLELLPKKARLHEELDQLDAAVEVWHRLLEQDPYSERACRNLMILYADTGRRQAAVDLFHRFRDRLEQDLGAGPEKQTIHILSMIS